MRFLKGGVVKLKHLLPIIMPTYKPDAISKSNSKIVRGWVNTGDPQGKELGNGGLWEVY
jgi:hypothetical protein